MSLEEDVPGDGRGGTAAATFEEKPGVEEVAVGGVGADEEVEEGEGGWAAAGDEMGVELVEEGEGGGA